MRKLIAFEIRRTIHSINFVLSLFFGLILVAAQFITIVLPYACSDLYEVWRQGLDGLCPMSLFHTWFGMTGYSPFTTAFFVFAPLLSCMPTATKLIDDSKAGYCNHIISKYSRRKYLVSTSVSSFIIGGMSICLPLILGFVSASTMIPAVFPDPVAGTFPIEEFNFLSEIYYSHPFVYLLIYLILNFIVYGLTACFGLLLGYLGGNKGIAVASSITLSMAAEMVSGALGFECVYSLRTITAPYQPQLINSITVVLVISILLFAICVMIRLSARKMRHP